MWGTGSKSVEYAAADPLRGRVGRAQGRVALLQRLQLAHERVVLAVADGRRVEHVVAVLVLLDLGGEHGVPLARLGRRLGQPHRWPPSTGGRHCLLAHLTPSDWPFAVHPAAMTHVGLR